jgi:hypothetical protein
MGREVNRACDLTKGNLRFDYRGRRTFYLAIEHRNDPALATGKTVRPHMRRAHSHLYWTGNGREIPRVRFLLPISVTGGKLIEEPERPIETKVR